ncbi:MAG: oxidoreductase [Gammaproteobacteria bacterium]|nr:MAG: oxidoreductase [Gammaproteobacteria bacterium]
MVNVAVVGVGGWGKNLARNYAQIPDARLKYICDLNPRALAACARLCPESAPTESFDRVLDDGEIDAVVVATTGETHYALCKKALEAGKDVFVEKPFVLDVAHAEELIALAEARGRILMVGHLLEYHPVVEKLRVLRESLGRIYYIYSQRLNLGTVREDENALWNFAPHDISVILYLLERTPTRVAATGQSYLQPGIEDVVFLTLYFGDEAMAHVHVSWLDPHKVRRMTIVGSEKMAVFDDLAPTEKLKVYDKGARVNTDYNSFAEYVSLRFGDITIPYLKMAEPLRLECEHFLACVRERRRPLSDGLDGLNVVRVLTAAQRSLKDNGAPVSLS